MADTGAHGVTRLRIDQGPVRVFAQSLLEDNPQNLGADLTGVPVPPTYPFVMSYWGRISNGEVSPVTMLMAKIGELLGRGGTILHGEQEFIYHRPIRVGDVLVARPGETSSQERDGSRGGTMTFLSADTHYDDETGQPAVTSRMTLVHIGGAKE